MKIISGPELKEKINRRDNFKLVMTFHEMGFRAKHIPGSLNISSKEGIVGVIDPSDEIVIYCVNERCLASIAAYRQLIEHGFTNVSRFAGGLEEWEKLGYPLEGNQVNQPLDADHNFRL